MELTLEQANMLMITPRGSLYLYGPAYSDITSLPEGLIVGGNLHLVGPPVTSLPEDLVVGGSLTLYDTRLASLPKGLTVGQSLAIDLHGTDITSLPEDLVVGGSLDLFNTGCVSLPKRLAVGGRIRLDGKAATKQVRHRLRNGDYVPGRYLYVNKILTPVKTEKHLDGYTVYIGKIEHRNVVSDGKNYIHCDKIQDGIADLTVMAAADRGMEHYKSLSLDDELPLDEAKAMYRFITGAFRQEAEECVASLRDKLKDRCTVREMLELTRGRYGHTKLAAFFGQ